MTNDRLAMLIRTPVLVTVFVATTFISSCSSDERSGSPATVTESPTMTASSSATTPVPTPVSSTAPMPVTSSPATSTTIPDITTDLAAFDAVIEKRTIAAGSNDVSVAIARDGRVLHTFTAARNRPALPASTAFRLASISKTVTAVVALRLVDAGLLDLDRPVVGDIARRAGYELGDPRSAEITLRQLLSHTSGFDGHLDYFFAPTTDDVSVMLRTALGDRLWTDPGAGYRYSNINFHLVGLLIEQVTGKRYQEVAYTSLLEPLGLTSFRYAVVDSNVEGEPWYSVTSNRRYMERLGAAGAWTASASDVALLLDSLNVEGVDEPDRWRPLSDATRREMFTIQTPSPAGPDWDYGLGVRIFASGAVGHSGTIESVHTMAITRPDGLTLVVLVNGAYPKETDELLDVLFEAEMASRISS